MADLSNTKTKPADVVALRRNLEILRLRGTGMSYRAIEAQLAAQVAENGMPKAHAVSHVRVKEICDELMREVAEHAFKEAGSLLGTELERMDALIRQAWAIILGENDPGDRLRAMEVVRRCSESRVRWLGLAAPERVQFDVMSRGDVHRGELAGLEGEALDRELLALGVTIKGELPPAELVL